MCVRAITTATRVKGKQGPYLKKPVVTYDIVSYDRKAVCPDLFATLANVFAGNNLKIFSNYC
jgi:hypothetical protein